MSDTCDKPGHAEMAARPHLEAHAFWGCATPELMAALIDAVIAEQAEMIRQVRTLCDEYTAGRERGSFPSGVVFAGLVGDAVREPRAGNPACPECHGDTFHQVGCQSSGTSAHSCDNCDGIDPGTCLFVNDIETVQP